MKPDTLGDCKKDVFAVLWDLKFSLEEKLLPRSARSDEVKEAKPSYSKTVLENGDTVFAGWFGIMVFDKDGRPKLRGSSDGRTVEKF
jgi:hypothetical protein